MQEWALARRLRNELSQLGARIVQFTLNARRMRRLAVSLRTVACVAGTKVIQVIPLVDAPEGGVCQP